ncbi:hypothetical protein [Blautia marasmi]|uniref:phage tail protein n=1 Tax=Blautia marasmi TaxID=1917868 RepID=UPI003AB9B696
MALSVGQIGLDLVVNKNQFQKQMSGITGIAKKAGSVLATAFDLKKIVDFGKQCIELGSNLAEVQNVVDVTFPHMTAQVDQFAKSAAASFGLSETMAKQFTGNFGAMAQAFGFSEKQAYNMGTTLTGLAGDVASFYNISQDEAYTKLKSVFTGETESLKDLGVVMTQNALDAYAMANGWGKTTQAMSEAEKVALRYQFVQEQLSAASGDFVRTSDSWANQVRVLKLQFDSLKAALGQGLINILTPVLKLLNQLLGKLMTAASAFKSFTEMLTGKKAEAGSGFRDTASDLSAAAGAADSLTDSTKDVGKAAEKASRSLMGFDKINKLQDKGGSEGGGTQNLPIKGMDINYGNLAEGDTVIDELDSKFQNMFQNIQRNIQPTIDSFKRLWNEGLKQLGSFTQTALGDFFSGFLGKVAGWLFQTGIPGFVDALNDGLMDIKFEDINEALRGLWDALAPFAIHVGEGLLWFWQNVLVPLGVWTANEVVPRFLDTLAIAVEAVNRILEALQPLFQWFWDTVLQPLASWAGGIFLDVWDKINGALKAFSEWCNKNPNVIQGITVTVAAFFAAWKGIELLSFIQQSGGIVGALGRISKSLFGATAAKVKDKIETLYLNALYAKDFVMGIGASVKALAMQAKQFVVNTAAKVADKAETLYLNALYAKDFVVNLAKSTAALVKQAAQFTINTALKIADTIAQTTMTAATAAWNAVCTIATTLTKALGAAIAFMTSPIGLVIIAFTALIAIGVLVYKNWDFIKEKATAIWGAIKDWFDSVTKKIGEFFSRLWSGIEQKFRDVGSWFKQKFDAASEGIKNAFSGIRNFFSGVWDGIKNTFSHVADWFRDKFSAAWKAVKDVFSTGGKIFDGIKDGILNGLKTVINALIGGINKVIKLPFDGLNGALDKMRSISIAGFKPFTWLPSIGTPQIPKLAQGGFVKANTPRLAMIGDNRHYGEIVAPEDKLQAMVNTAVKAAGGSGLSKADVESIVNSAVTRFIAAVGKMGFFVDGELLARALDRALSNANYRQNPVEVT